MNMRDLRASFQKFHREGPPEPPPQQLPLQCKMGYIRKRAPFWGVPHVDPQTLNPEILTCLGFADALRVDS